jgi:hypothetical protein
VATVSDGVACDLVFETEVNLSRCCPRPPDTTSSADGGQQILSLGLNNGRWLLRPRSPSGEWELEHVVTFVELACCEILLQLELI